MAFSKSGWRASALAGGLHHFVDGRGRDEPVIVDHLAGREWDARERMSQLAEAFPCLVDKPGVRPWKPEDLDWWAVETGATGAELFATRFILHVWDGERVWSCGRFDLLNALDHWDEHHRRAFASWVMDPWWPLSLYSSESEPEPLSRDTVPEPISLPPNSMSPNGAPQA